MTINEVKQAYQLILLCQWLKSVILMYVLSVSQALQGNEQNST